MVWSNNDSQYADGGLMRARVASQTIGRSRPFFLPTVAVRNGRYQTLYSVGARLHCASVWFWVAGRVMVSISLTLLGVIFLPDDSEGVFRGNFDRLALFIHGFLDIERP